jgi:hypothetical protein
MSLDILTPLQSSPVDTSNRWLGVVTLLIIVAISYVDRVNVSVLITDRVFTDHFGITGDRVIQGALTTTFLVGYGIAAFFLTPFYEALLGIRRGLLGSIAAWAVLTLISPYALGATVLLTFRLVLGSPKVRSFRSRRCTFGNISPTTKSASQTR